METSLRYGGDSKSLRIHAKEKIPISSNSICQLQGELDMKLGAPTFLNGMIRYFHPELLASLGVGVRYNRRDKVHYHIRGKKIFPVTADGLFNFNVKGRCDIDDELKQVRETNWTFRVDQNRRWNVRYDL